MARTTETAVREILVNHYDGSTTLSPFIEAAAGIVTWLTGKDEAGILSATQLELIERWLSAHYYLQSDPILQSKTTGKSSGAFEGKTEMFLDNTRYGQMAKTLDLTGNLALLGRAKAKMTWLGKPKSEQIAYEDRD